MGLKEIIDNNSYPIIFIGSGMSKRYLKDSESWEELLQLYWERLNSDTSFYSKLHDISKKYSTLPRDELEFQANTEIATIIQKDFDDKFYNNELKVAGLTSKDAYTQKISPFKFDLSNHFSKQKLREDINVEEYNQFKILLSKAKIIVTTNYDQLIETCLQQQTGHMPKVFIGQNGFFDETDNWSELYKIHGSSSAPNSLVITHKDYENYDKRSILISAKILSTMISSPIVFLGYSLTDRNVRKLLSDFSSQLPQEDTRKSANRILVVEYENKRSTLKETIINDRSLDFTYTSIQTDNYTQLFTQLNKIDQGATPLEVRKYSSLIKKLVEDSGKKGELESVLVSAENLDKIDDQISQGRRIVVALGDSKYIYKYPDLLSYIKDYFLNTNNYLPAVALSFAAHDNNKNTKIPFAKYWNNVDLAKLKLPNDDLVKLRDKIACYPTLDSIINSIGEYDQLTFHSIDDIRSKSLTSMKFISVVTYNLKRLDKKELNNYVLNEALSGFESAIKDKTNLKTAYRKLFVGYDLLINGDFEQ
ncbi:SIR2 family protein [Pediococcus acidilactici]|uniref:SIR2 family protein n=1 Tax=Pediococcus acidilactici TaxID=1254 RepID=UPI001329D00A|nr:SIR2 family protein [Pediococcus acidilactici]KAF0375331.1 hypothetical protein GBO57_04650 [Pediococcus acidilactici]KAF0406723.1 hypothetical protein GBO76_04600 [Pediococcus acidilactici]KAF0418198.1 hypothetical protein GBO81_04600 [Pediococcus acidilactici]KAF0455479.1 hypothetical protein GBP01_04585 [Pediococcus acidilactici]KAF0486551.1 hypothetical protein GBP17_04645 [Pediococcus acidilactici]